MEPIDGRLNEKNDAHTTEGVVSGKWVVLMVTCVAAFVVPFFGSAVNVALPSIAEDFNMDTVQLGWVVMSFTLATAILLLPAGRLADIYGRNRIFSFGTAVFTVTSLLCAIAPTGFALIGFRVLQAVGTAMIFGISLAIVSSVYTQNDRGRAIGIYTASLYMGLSVGPYIGGLLTDTFGWRSIFLANVPLGLMMTFVAFWKLKREHNEAAMTRFDTSGALLYGFALFAVTYGLSQLPDAYAGFWIAGGIVMTMLFLKWEHRVPNPLLDVNWFTRNVVFALSNLVALIHFCGTYAVVLFLSLYLQYIHELTPQMAGLILVTQPVSQTLLSPFAGRLSDRIEPQILATLGMAVTTLGLLLLVFLDETTPMRYTIFCLVVLGIGFALFSSANYHAIMSSVEEKMYGVASGIVATSRTLGMVLSIGIAMTVFAIYIGDVEITTENYSSLMTSMKTAFIIFSCLCLVGVLVSIGKFKFR